MNFTFNTRDTYFEYVADWRERYEARCKEQRRLKLSIRNKMREGDTTYSNDQWSLRKGVEKAQELITERQLSRIEACHQWELAHETV
jgi:hypothetical protein